MYSARVEVLTLNSGPYRPSFCRSVEIISTLLSALLECGGPDSELWSLGSRGKCPIHSAISTAASLEYTLPGLLYTSDQSPEFEESFSPLHCLYGGQVF